MVETRFMWFRHVERKQISRN